MAGTKGNSGGARKGAGAPRKNQRFGARNDREGLHNFFPPSTNAREGSSTGRPPSISTNSSRSSHTTTRSSSISTTRGNSSNSNSAHNPRSTSTTTAVARDSSASTRRNSDSNSTNPRSTSTTTAVARDSSASTRGNVTRARTDIPNSNVEDTFDDSEFHMGKRIRKSSYLVSQQKLINEESYYKKAAKSVSERGILWDIPPTFIKKPRHDLKERWKDFYYLRVFHWMPDLLLRDDWKPKCPNCSHHLAKNGHKNPPRLVFDQHDNYWLNSPHAYVCKPCSRKYSKLDKADPSRKQYVWNCVNDEILSQIAAEDPEVFDLLPCHLTHKNAIDKKLMLTIVDNAVKGVGPSAMGENITSWHELEWARREAQWGGNVVRELENPRLNFQQRGPIRRDEIEKFPPYFSDKLGGCVPSGNWLLEMFCIVIEQQRPYLDSEIIKRLKTSILIAIDASYKMPNWMMKWGGSKIYDALFSATNEYNEVPMQFLATSDNHSELRANLIRLRELGLNPRVVFTDNPLRDESLLKEVFPNLVGEETAEEVETDTSLTDVVSEKAIMYVYKYEDACTALSLFINDIEAALSNPDHGKVKISFDAEWPMYISRNNHRAQMTKGNINIFQLASNVTQYTILLELYNFKSAHQLEGIGRKLKAIFSLKVSCFTGCNHKSDYTNLAKQYPMFNLDRSDAVMKRMEDVGLMAVNRGVTTRGKDKTSLQALCRGQKMNLTKPKQVRVGETFKSTGGSLSQEAQKYCQLDAEVPLTLHSLYSQLPDLTERMTTSQLNVGITVDIMPESKRAVNPIAQGVITQVGGKWQPSCKLKSNQVTVRVTKVFNKKGVIHYPCTNTHLRKCACGQSYHGLVKDSCSFYMFSQLGRPPFTVMELSTRLRKYNQQIQYPMCVYTDEENTEVTTDVTNFVGGQEQTQNLQRNENDDSSGVTPDDEGDDDDCVLEVEDEVLQSIPEELFQDMGNEDPSDERQKEKPPTPEQIRIATDLQFNTTLDKIIDDADKLAGVDGINFDEIHDLEEDGLPLDQLKDSECKKVLGDMFHCHDRCKLPMHHEYKGLFFRALRAASFLMMQCDVDNVKAVLESKPGESWEKKMAFDYDYIAKRVRRRVPPPAMLYHRMKAVFDFFKDKKDTVKGGALFSKDNQKKFENMLEMVKQGYMSDPPMLSMYLQRTDKFGRKMFDKDGLPLYRSLRGTSNLESLHQYLTTSFGHTTAGPRYCDNLLAVVKHQYNWRASRKNRPNFPQLSHYNGLLIDRVNHLYEIIYGYTKYVNWESFNENLPVDSPFGIVAVDQELTKSIKCTEEDKNILSKNKMLSYLSRRQKADLPFLPVRGEKEQRTAHRKLRELLTNDESLSSQTVFEKLSDDWNQNEINIAEKSYPKFPIHFSRYIKRWKKNRNTRDAALSSGSDRLSQVLEQPLQVQNAPTYVPIPLTNNSNVHNSSTEALSTNISTPNNPTAALPANSATPTNPTERAVLERPLAIMARAASTQQAIETQVAPTEKRKRRRKTCQGIKELKRKCPMPDKCKGAQDNANCILRTGGDPTKERKRTITNWTRPKCFTCRREGCLGITQRDKCPDWVG